MKVLDVEIDKYYLEFFNYIEKKHLKNKIIYSVGADSFF